MAPVDATRGGGGREPTGRPDRWVVAGARSLELGPLHAIFAGDDPGLPTGGFGAIGTGP